MTRPAVGYLIRIELRRQAKSLLVLGLLVALVVGTVVASLAGARRSASAFDRYLEALPQRRCDGLRCRTSPGEAPVARQARMQMDQLDAVDDTLDFELVAAFPTGITEEFFPLVVAETVSSRSSGCAHRWSMAGTRTATPRSSSR